MKGKKNQIHRSTLDKKKHKKNQNRFAIFKMDKNKQKMDKNKRKSKLFFDFFYPFYPNFGLKKTLQVCTKYNHSINWVCQ